MVKPPETEMTWPVMKEASSLPKKTMALAKSSGWPKRPRGMALLNASPR
jgi:hypothetical protein